MRRRMLAGILLAAALATSAAAQDAPSAVQRTRVPAFWNCCRRRRRPSTLSACERQLDYAVTAGTLPLRDGKGERTAEIFHVAFTAEPADPIRPLTFLFNGGPGAASAFLMLGGVGPRMVAFREDGGFLPPPSRLVDNPELLAARSPISCSSIRSAPATAAAPWTRRRLIVGSSASGRTPQRWRRSSGSASRGPGARCRPSSWPARAMADFARQCSAAHCRTMPASRRAASC